MESPSLKAQVEPSSIMGGMEDVDSPTERTGDLASSLAESYPYEWALDAIDSTVPPTENNVDSIVDGIMAAYPSDVHSTTLEPITENSIQFNAAYPNPIGEDGRLQISGKFNGKLKKTFSVDISSLFFLLHRQNS